MILTGLGGGTPGGATTQIQYNNAGVFGGSPNLTFDANVLVTGTTPFVNIGLAYPASAAFIAANAADFAELWIAAHSTGFAGVGFVAKSIAKAGDVRPGSGIALSAGDGQGLGACWWQMEDTTNAQSSDTGWLLNGAGHYVWMANMAGDVGIGKVASTFSGVPTPITTANLKIDGATGNATFIGTVAATSVSVGLNTPGFLQQRPNANTAQILMQSTVPPEGRTFEAPFMWWQSGATFLSEWDSVMYLGYNADRGVTTEPAMRWVIEGNYKTGASTRTTEAYVEYVDRSNLAGAEVWRPFFITADKDSLVNKTFTLTAPDTINVQAKRAVPLTMKFLPFNTNNEVLIVVGGGIGTATNTSNLLILSGGATVTDGGSVLMQGNTSTNVAGDKGSVVLTGGNVTSPTAASLQGAVSIYTGATPTQRLRVQPDGNIAIGKPAVLATAYVHLGAGTTAASTAPLKFTSGSLNTTAEAGAVEFLTDAFYGTITTGAARKTFAFLESPSFTAPVTLTGVVGSSALTITGATQTASFPFFNLTQTWNNAGVVFTGMVADITATLFAATSKYFDYKVGGTSRLKLEYSSANGWTLDVSQAMTANHINATTSMTTPLIRFGIGGLFSGDVILSRESAAVLQIGTDVNGAAVAQTFKAHDGITGTNIAGANLTIAGGRGTGTGAPGNLIFQTSVQVASGTTAQTLGTRFEIIENKIGFFGATPVVQGASVADATGGAIIDAEARTALNALISRIEATGLIATV